MTGFRAGMDHTKHLDRGLGRCPYCGGTWDVTVDNGPPEPEERPEGGDLNCPTCGKCKRPVREEFRGLIDIWIDENPDSAENEPPYEELLEAARMEVVARKREAIAS